MEAIVLVVFARSRLFPSGWVALREEGWRLKEEPSIPTDWL